MVTCPPTATATAIAPGNQKIKKKKSNIQSSRKKLKKEKRSNVQSTRKKKKEKRKRRRKEVKMGIFFFH